MSDKIIDQNKFIAAAVKRGEEVITGKRHHECIYSAIMKGWKKPVRIDEQGFVDFNGDYYSRDEAREWLIENGYDVHYELLSEHLW